MNTVRDLLDRPIFLILWFLLMIPSLIWVIYDLRTRNTHLMSLMKVVWVLTVYYSGPVAGFAPGDSFRGRIFANSTDPVLERIFPEFEEMHVFTACALDIPSSI